jgi:hypothetical protein
MLLLKERYSPRGSPASRHERRHVATPWQLRLFVALLVLCVVRLLLLRAATARPAEGCGGGVRGWRDGATLAHLQAVLWIHMCRQAFAPKLNPPHLGLRERLRLFLSSFFSGERLRLLLALALRPLLAPHPPLGS